MKQIYLINQLPHIRGLCLKSKGIVLSLLMLFTILFSSEIVNAQSGTVTFTGTSFTNIGTVLHDGTNSNDISGIQLDIFGAMTPTAATSRTSSGSFVFFDAIDLGLINNAFVPIDVTSGNSTINESNLPRIIVIMSHDGSEFNFKSINVGDYIDSNSPIKFEGFRNGTSTGSVSLSIGAINNYEKTFDSSNGLTASIFQNVDEIRITNQNGGDMYYGIYAGFNNIQIGAAVLPAPTVSGISPTNGPVAGGTSVSITGTNFTGATSVKFGSNNATGFTINSATSITATSPAGSGTADVTVTTTGGTSATSAADQFTYIAAPTITSISPTNGITTGGTSVTIIGTNFTGATSVKFGSSNATGYTVNSPTQITATSPAGSGTVDITVTTTGGTNATSAADQFTYVAAPTITSISPTSGPTAGGTSVSITGTNFIGATAVKFGSNNATGFTINSATSITATSPAGSGTVDITVITTGGTSATSAADQFTYIAAPTITSISPTNGLTTGGTSVTITGTNFIGATAVKFGSTNATGFTVNSATSITATSPAGSGTVDIKVTTVGGTSATSTADQFIYLTPGTWTGLASTSHWTDAGNWSDNQVPTATSNVTIPGLPIGGYLPLIFPGDATDCNNLTSDNGALEILSSSSGTGSLIVHGTASGLVQTDIYVPKNEWHVVAPACEGYTISDFLNNGSNQSYLAQKNVSGTIYYGITDYDEKNNKWNEFFTLSTPGSLTSGKGYTLRTADDSYILINYGNIVTGTKTISLAKEGEGWNCIGNPYSSAINIKATADNSSFLYYNTVTNTGIIDSNYGAIYLWDPSSSQYKVICNASFNFTTTQPTRVLSQNYVAPGQGFFVKAATNGASVTFTPAMQSHQNNTNAPSLKSAKVSWPAIKLNITNDKATASTIIAFNKEMTTGVDATYDAGLLRGTTGVNLYSRLVDDNGIDFAIQCLPEDYNATIPLGVESKTGGQISFNVETVELPDYCEVSLEDKATNTITTLSDNTSYIATVDANTKGIGRFYLHLKNSNTTTGLESDANSTITAYSINNVIYIKGNVQQGATAQLFDLMGKQIMLYTLQAGNLNSLNTSIPNGVYVIKVNNKNQVVSKKVAILNK